MNIYSAKQLYEADQITSAKQEISSIELMERAATQIFNWLHHRMQGAQVPIHIFCGIGNNGGDGLALGRLLIENGYNVTMYVANFTAKRSKCFLINYDRVKNVTKKWPILMTSDQDFPEIHPDDIIVDAIFGIGLNRAPEGWVKGLIQYLNSQKAFRLSVDIPSGMAANTPLFDAEAVIKANHTLTFQAPKIAFFLPETGPFVPYYEAMDIGLDQEFLMNTKPLARLVAKPMAQTFYKQRKKYAYKGSFGHSLLVGGSPGKLGAILLTTKAALRTGSGLATVCVPPNSTFTVHATIPEAMVVTHGEGETISEIKTEFNPTVIGIGPGMGQARETWEAFKELLKGTDNPMVIDADAIHLIAQHPTEIKNIPKKSIFTPHVGELEKLIGAWENDFEKLDKTKAFCKKHDMIVVIKGANTMTIFGDEIYINTTGNPGMATAGSGDVLTGVITALVAQGYDPEAAALFGVFLHGSAGNIVAQANGFETMIASDIIDNMGQAFLDLFKQEQPPAPEGAGQ